MLLELKNISKRFPGVVALDDVSIELAKGEVHALAGENGAGKSTLIKVLAGRYHPDAGAILFDGKQVEIADPLKASRMGISVVYQEYNLLPKLTVQDNILLGREPLGSLGRIDRAASRAEVRALAERMKVDIDPDSYVADLGAAEAKIVEIMKALAARVEVLILDEPTAALPEKDVAALFAVIRSLREGGVTVVYISHRLEEIFSIADRVSVLKDGQLVGTWPVAEIDRDFLVRSMVGRELTDIYPPRRGAPAAEEVLSGEGLRGPNLAGVSFALRAGEILGVGGMTGNGQREFLRSLFGAHPLTAGTIRFRGRPARIGSPREAMDLGLGFIPDDRRNEGLSVSQSVQRNLSLPSLGLRQTAGVIRRKQERETAEGIVRDLDIKLAALSQPARGMSGGNQQRAVIGKWLPMRPKVLLFLEPTLGIDVGARVEIYRLMRRLTSQGVAILMVSSDMLELLNVPDRILVFWRGAIAAEFAAGQASEEAVMFAASGGKGESGAAPR
jgi:ribose transport system ATP-binding protein